MKADDERLEQELREEIRGLPLRFEELLQIVAHWIGKSMRMHWEKFLRGEPVRDVDDTTVWARLREIRDALHDDDKFVKAVMYGCALFCVQRSESGHHLLFQIFLHGDAAAREAARQAIRSYQDDQRFDVDEALQEVLNRVHVAEDRFVPPEVERQMDTVLGPSGLAALAAFDEVIDEAADAENQN